MERLNRIRYVTENFYSLQGLVYIPSLLFVLVVVVGERVGLYRAGNLDVRFLLLLLTIIISRRIARYYRQTFGEIAIEQKWSERVWFIGIAVALVADNFLRWHVSLFGLSAAAFWLYHGWKSDGLRPHYAVMGALTALASFLPLVISPLETANVWHTVTVTILAMIGMVFDHLLLVRLMPPAGES
ncbi:MAG: hypothetical protein K8I30_15850 [Anaerolineae bacterium]|nr:hypothetical protein [Anaerolineae bacterium]